MDSDSRIEEICKKLQDGCNNPRTELNYYSEYMFLVAVVLSAQSTDVQVNRVMSKLFQKYKTVDDIIALGIEGLQEHIKSIGLYRNKSKNIVALSKILKEKYDNKIPDSREKLEILPGVGRKSANVILNTLFNQNTIAVDTHVLRVTNRLNLSNSNNPLKVESDLESIIPSKYKKNISNLLVLHGRYVCKAKRPLCENCVINKLCHARKVKK